MNLLKLKHMRLCTTPFYRYKLPQLCDILEIPKIQNAHCAQNSIQIIRTNVCVNGADKYNLNTIHLIKFYKKLTHLVLPGS